MKSLKIAFLSLAFVLIGSFSQAQKMEWKQQSDFHSVMSKTFHPAEEGNFTPIKARSAELVAAATAWKNSEIPADVADKKLVKKSLKQLVKGSKSINKKIAKGASDAVLKTDLFALHDTFHTIVGLCNAKDEHGEH